MKHTIILIAALLLFAGCAGEQRAIKYYTIDSYVIAPPDTIAIGLEAPLPYVVEIIDFSIAGPYNDARIALRTGSNELEYYHYHHWAETPGHAVRHFVWKILHDARVFDVCQLRLTVTAPQFVVTGAINKLERMDVEGEAGALVDGVFDFVDVRTKRIIISHRFNTFTSFADNASMNVFAQEVGAIFSNEVFTFIDKINDHFKSD